MARLTALSVAGAVALGLVGCGRPAPNVADIAQASAANVAAAPAPAANPLLGQWITLDDRHDGCAVDFDATAITQVCGAGAMPVLRQATYAVSAGQVRISFPAGSFSPTAPDETSASIKFTDATDATSDDFGGPGLSLKRCQETEFDACAADARNAASAAAGLAKSGAGK